MRLYETTDTATGLITVFVTDNQDQILAEFNGYFDDQIASEINRWMHDNGKDEADTVTKVKKVEGNTDE